MRGIFLPGSFCNNTEPRREIEVASFVTLHEYQNMLRIDHRLSSPALSCILLTYYTGSLISQHKYGLFAQKKKYVTITFFVIIQFHGAPVLWKTRKSKNKILYYICFAFLYLPSHLTLFRRSIRSPSANVIDLPSVDGCLQKWLLKITNVDTEGDLQKCSLNMANVDRTA